MPTIDYHQPPPPLGWRRRIVAAFLVGLLGLFATGVSFLPAVHRFDLPLVVVMGPAFTLAMLARPLIAFGDVTTLVFFAGLPTLQYALYGYLITSPDRRKRAFWAAAAVHAACAVVNTQLPR